METWNDNKTFGAQFNCFCQGNEVCRDCEGTTETLELEEVEVSSPAPQTIQIPQPVKLPKIIKGGKVINPPKKPQVPNTLN